jgi:hypothetical protein
MISVFSVPVRSLPLGIVVGFFFPPILWRKSRQNVTLTASFCAIVMLQVGNSLSQRALARVRERAGVRAALPDEKCEKIGRFSFLSFLSFGIRGHVRGEMARESPNCSRGGSPGRPSKNQSHGNASPQEYSPSPERGVLLGEGAGGDGCISAAEQLHPLNRRENHGAAGDAPGRVFPLLSPGQGGRAMSA